MVVHFHDGTKRIIDADKKLIGSDGTLKLFQYESIGAYMCPLRVREVETFAPGMWKSVRSDWGPSQETLDKGTQDEPKAE